MATVSQLESMPPELKIALLKFIPDVGTLSALVHASPVFHEVYIAKRCEILTSVTLRELSRIKLDVGHFGSGQYFVPKNVDIFKRQIIPWSWSWAQVLKSAILSYHTQWHAGRKYRIILSVKQCVALRAVGHCRINCVPYKKEEMPPSTDHTWEWSNHWSFVPDGIPGKAIISACIFMLGRDSPITSGASEVCLSDADLYECSGVYTLRQ